MNPSDPRSRPARLFAEVGGRSAGHDVFDEAVVVAHLDTGVANERWAKETLVALVDQLIRFCPAVVISVPNTDDPVVARCREAAAAFTAATAGLLVVAAGEEPRANVVIAVGCHPGPGGAECAVSASGWVARLVVKGSAAAPPPTAEGNPLAVRAAAALGAGYAFLTIAGAPSPPTHELSVYEGASGPIGTFAPGPPIPVSPELDALLLGCGGVGHGWGTAMGNLSILRAVRLVDRQRLGPENLGSYPSSSHREVSLPKTSSVARLVGGDVSTNEHPENLQLFTIRFEFGLELPAVVVAGFDNVPARHALQRLWPALLIDMGAGGTTAQVLVHRRGAGGQCLLGALTAPPGAPSMIEEAAAATGLRPERIATDPTGLITVDDVAAALPEHREALVHAERTGQLVCGQISARFLGGGPSDEDFVASAAFVTGLAGTLGAAATVREAMDLPVPSGAHIQYDFRSGRGRLIVMRCRPGCECEDAAGGQPRVARTAR